MSLASAAGWNSASGSEHDLNRLGFWLGAGTQTENGAQPRPGAPGRRADLPPPRLVRVALVTRQLNIGRSASPAA